MPAHQDEPRKRHRSFYMRSDDADRLAAIADDLHYETRRPRYEVFGALVHVADRHQAEIREQLTRDHDQETRSEASPGKDGGPR